MGRIEIEQGDEKVNKKLPFAIPTLTGKQVTLRPITRDDYKHIFKWQTDTRQLHLWWADRDILPFEEFVTDLERRLRRFIHTIFIIESINDKKPAGMVYSYNTSMLDRYTYLCVYLSPEYIRKSMGPEAGKLFANYLFQYYGFRKIYAEIISYNQGSLRLARWNGFVQEGCLKDYRWFGNCYWDLHILAISADKFMERIEKNTRNI